MGFEPTTLWLRREHERQCSYIYDFNQIQNIYLFGNIIFYDMIDWTTQYFVLHESIIRGKIFVRVYVRNFDSMRLI